MVRFSKEEMNKASKTIRASLRKNNTLPSSVKMKDMEGKNHNMTKKQYAGLFESENVFRIKNNRQPNYVTFKSTANNPLVMDYQSYKMSCCPTSLSMASQLLYNYKSENECIKKLGTDVKEDGTSPSQLVNNAPKLGFKVKSISRNKQSVTNSLKLNKPVIAHIDTSKAPCLEYSKNYGHYILIYAVKGDYYKVADPSRGLKQCKTTVLDTAMKGRKINYYSISLK